MLIKDITHLDYQELRQISPEAARRAILQVLKAHNGNVTTTAKILSVSRATIYKAIRKNEAGDLKDGSKAPHRVHNKTSVGIEARMLALRDKARYGALRLKEGLAELDGVHLFEHTIRNILRRNKAKTKLKQHKPHKKGSRPYVDWYQAKAFEIVQIDLKYVVDQKALSLEQIQHFHNKQFPLYQWTAVDVNSRFKLMAYSYQKSWTNGLTFFFISAVEKCSIRSGDFLAPVCGQDDQVIAHLVVKIVGDYYLFKGDNVVVQNDSLIPSEKVLGRV